MMLFQGERMNTKKICVLGVLITLSMIFSYVESVIVIVPNIPGLKLGFANVCVLFCLYKYSAKEAFWVLVLRIILVGFIFTSLSSIIYSLCGGITAFVVMMLLKGTKKFSLIAVSTAGGVAHNIGQIIVAVLVLQTKAIIYYFPTLILFGAISGFLMGVITKEIVFRIKRVGEIK